MRPSGPTLVLLCFALAICLTLFGCMTMTLVAESKGELGHQARIAAIRSAWTIDDDLVLHVEVQPRGRHDAHLVRFHLAVAQIGTYGGFERDGSYEQGDLKLSSPPLGCFEPADGMPAGASPLPVRQLSIRDYADLEPALRTLPVGVHVIALKFDRGVGEGQQVWGSADSVVLDKNSTMALVLRGSDGSARKELIWGFDEKSRTRPALLLLMPLSVAGDIITFPFQIIAALMSEC